MPSVLLQGALSAKSVLRKGRLSASLLKPDFPEICLSENLQNALIIIR